MSRFIVPKGMEYTFTIQIMEQDSFLPQNLTGYIDGSLKILNKLDGTEVAMTDLMPVINKPEDNTVAEPEVTELTIPDARYEKYTLTVKGEVYELDKETDIFSVTPIALSGTPTAGDLVGTIDIISSLNLYGSVSDANGYYEVLSNGIVLTASGATNAIGTDEYTVRVGTKTQATSPSGSFVTNEEFTIADSIATEIARIMNLALPTDVTASSLTNVLTITETAGGEISLVKTTNMIQTNYTLGVPARETNYYRDNGYLMCTISAANTAVLDVVRGDKVDNYYLLSDYTGVIDLNFTDTSLDRVAKIQDIYVAFAGV